MKNKRKCKLCNRVLKGKIHEYKDFCTYACFKKYKEKEE